MALANFILSLFFLKKQCYYNNMSKILVTGGAGFIGSTLVDKLIAAGHEVAVIDNLSSGCRSYVNPAAHLHEVDICSSKIEKIFKKEQFDFVYHLAAQIDVRKSVASPEFDNQINIGGGLNILKACHAHNVKKIILASTGGAIYGEAEEMPTPENYPTYPLSPYGIHKLTLEKYLHYYYQVYGLNYTILRFANVYGPRQFKGGEAGVIAIFTENAVSGQESLLFGDGLQTRDFVYVDDVVSALMVALEIDCRGEINIGSGQEIDLKMVIESIERALGATMKIKTQPAKIGEQRRSVLSSQRAQTVLNWAPQVDLEEGIKRTINWTKLQKKQS